MFSYVTTLTHISIENAHCCCFSHIFPFHRQQQQQQQKKKNRKKYSQTKITSFLPFHTLFAGSLSFTKPRDFLAEKLGEKHKNINSENHQSLTNTIIHHKAISKRLTKQPIIKKIKET